MYILGLSFALAVALLCHVVEADYSTVHQLSGTVKDLDQVLLRVICGGSKCNIRDITLVGFTIGRKGKMNVFMTAGSASQEICEKSKDSHKCSPISIPETEFFIRLQPNPAFTGGRIIVKTRYYKASITELNFRGASVQKDPLLKKNYVRIKSGYQNDVFPSEVFQYEVKCNGHCGNLQFVARTNQAVKLLLSAAEPVFVMDGGCYRCYCQSSKNQRGVKICKDSDRNQRFSLPSNRVYVTLLPDKQLKDVEALLTGDNIQQISAYSTGYYWDLYVSQNGKKVAVYSVKGPFKGKTVDLEVFCVYRHQCKNIKIEILTTSTVVKVLAGKKISNPCEDCSCHDRRSCSLGFDPILERSGNYYQFKTRITLGESQLYYAAFVKISGDKVGGVTKI